MKKQCILLFLFLTGLLFTAKAQTLQLQNADLEAQGKNFTQAIRLYEKIAKTEKDNTKLIPIYQKIGDCYVEINRYNEALSWYDKFLQFEKNPDNKFKIKYARLVLESGQINQALTLFKALENNEPENQEIKRMVKSCEFALSELKKENLPPVVNLTQLNSPESEFGLGYFDDELIFASQRIVDNYSSIHGRTNEGYSDLYFTRFDSATQTFTAPTPLPGSINTPYNEGTFSYLPSLQIAYLTQCEKSPEVCRIMKSEYTKNKWSSPEWVNMGDEQYNYAHPCLTPDGKTMYFSSDMPGSFGGKDLWKAPVLADGSVGSPVNLGSEINTDKDEMFPSVVGDSILLFASDGHIGMGGLDIYFSKKTDNIFEPPVNVGAPINTTGDDFSILLKPLLNGGYYCSNKEPGKSDDIYSFSHNIFLKDLAGRVVDSITAQPLANVKLIYSTDNVTEKITYSDSTGAFYIPGSAHANCGHLHTLKLIKDGYISKTVNVPCHLEEELLLVMFNNSGIHSVNGLVTDQYSKQPIAGTQIVLSSSRGVTDTTFSDALGNYGFKNVPSNDYIVLRALKPDYLKDSKAMVTPDNTSVVNICSKNGYDTDFKLIPILYEVEFTIEDIYYAFDRADLLPESRTSLNKLVNLLNENPEVTIHIYSHTDERGTEAYNLTLSDRRSASVVAYLINAGIAKARLHSKGFGEARPVIKNAKTEEEHQKNRRTTFEITGMVSTANGSKSINSEIDISSQPVPTPATQTETWMTNTVLQKNSSSNQEKEVKPASSPGSETVYRIQLLATQHIPDDQKPFENIGELIQEYTLHVTTEGALNKYQLGDFKTKNEAEKIRAVCRQKGFADCFIVATKK